MGGKGGSPWLPQRPALRGKAHGGVGGGQGYPISQPSSAPREPPPSSVLCNEVQQGMRGTGGSLVLQEEGS